MATKVGPEKDKGSKTRQLSQRSHACFRLSAATVKRDLKGGALRFESTCADDDGAEGRFHRGLSDYCFTSRLLSRAPVCPATAAAVTWLRRCSVSHRAGSLGQLSRLPGQRLVARAAARFSSDQHPPELRSARARASRCSRAHTRVHAGPPPVVPIWSANCVLTNIDLVIVSD